ncbi:thioredoxin domain-containing protein [Haladaptatus paucihalophilus]|uniref:thioredoxin domain-containing protein n=1 Tax=Haladaptatus paucihalophilus TaxID=367189 RepID=UPI001E5B1535|nr:thioredoxin domain-containing protein [Haladaptatus paucihalophilus]
MRDDRRRVLGVIGAGLSAGIAGCSAFSKDGSPETTGERSGGEQSTTTEEGPAAPETTDTENDSKSASDEGPPEKVEPSPKAYRSVPLPSKPTENEYATMGDDDASVTAKFYGAWKCPYTHDFVLNILPTFIEEYVKPGDVAIEFRAVAYEDGEGFHGPDEPRAARAGLSVWNEDPESYWTYFGTMFQNQNSSPGWATTETLVRIAEEADVSHLSKITSQIEAKKYQSQIERTMDQVHEIPISAVPRIVVGDTVTAPTVNPKKTKAQLDAALGRGSGSDSETTTTTTTNGDDSDTTTTNTTTTTTNTTTTTGTSDTTTTTDDGSGTTTTTTTTTDSGS